MLMKSTSVLLLSDVPSFVSRYRKLAVSKGVRLKNEADWNENYRVKEEVVIMGSKYLPKLNKAYYPKAVIILKSSESPEPYVSEGITRFIFDFQNADELVLALYHSEAVKVQTSSMAVKDIIKEYGITSFEKGEYSFKFDKDVFSYKGRKIYLCKSQKEYLASWLLAGVKDNERRIVLFNLRKKFGKDFLSNVDRLGQLKEEKKDEQ